MSDFHIFSSAGDRGFLVMQEGLFGQRVFPSLRDATRYLRDYTKGRTGFVVIHDPEQRSSNRIPLHDPTVVN